MILILCLLSRKFPVTGRAVRQALILLIASLVPALGVVGCSSGESDDDEDEVADQGVGVKPDLDGVGVGAERPPIGSTTGVTTGTTPTGSSGTATESAAGTGSATGPGSTTGTGSTTGPGSTTGTTLPPEPTLCDFACLRMFDCDGDDVTNSCDVDPCDADIAELKPSCRPPDSDDDGVPDERDNCWIIDNPDQADVDNDGAGDVCDSVDCPDGDGDTVCDAVDNCPANLNLSQADMDSDGVGNPCDPDRDGDTVPNATDNCPDISNGDQANADGDAFGDVCENDNDNDGVLNAADACPNQGPVEADRVDATVETSWTGCFFDSDGDGISDPLEIAGCVLIDDTPADGLCSTTDADEDGIRDVQDNCLGQPNPEQTDSDGDGIGNPCDFDNDNDGLYDQGDLCPNNPDIWFAAYNVGNNKPETAEYNEYYQDFIDHQEEYSIEHYMPEIIAAGGFSGAILGALGALDADEVEATFEMLGSLTAGNFVFKAGDDIESFGKNLFYNEERPIRIELSNYAETLLDNRENCPERCFPLNWVCKEKKRECEEKLERFEPTNFQVVGTFQRDSDGDGMGDACDVRLIDPGRFPVTDTTVDYCTRIDCRLLVEPAEEDEVADEVEDTADAITDAVEDAMEDVLDWF